MTDRERLSIYVDLAPFIANVCGPGTEVVVHDVTDPDHSLIAISNNLSNRAIGDPMTDLALELQQKGTYTDTPYVSSYSGKSKGREFLSSTYFIKNKNRLIGLLCINRDTASIKNMNSALQNLLEQFNLTDTRDQTYSENLDTNVTNILHTRIADIVQRSGVEPARMSIDERIDIVRQLSEEGLFSVKGAAPEIACQLSISVPTLYRYLKQIPKDAEA